MAFTLLWIECLATALLLVATLLACIARLRERRHRVHLAILVLLLPLAGCTSLAVLAGVLKYRYFLPATRFSPLVVLTGLFLLGALWLLRRGLRAGSEEPDRPAAASWARGRLAIALGVAAALGLMTFWNLDLAARQRMEGMRMEAGALALSVAPLRVPDRDNAALVYRRAFEIMGPEKAWEDAWDEKWDRWLGQESPHFDPHDAALRESLRKHVAALDLLRQGAQKPGCWFDRDFGRPSYDMVLSELPWLRKGAQLLALDARCMAADGDLDGALEDVQTMFAMAEHVAGEPILVSLMVSIVVERLAADSLQAVLTSGQLSEAQLAALDINPDLSYGRHLERCLRMEEALMTSVVCRVALEREATGLDIDGQDLTRPLTPLYRVFMLRADLAGLRRATNEARFLATQPFHEVEERWRQIRDDLNRESGLFARMLMPALGRAARLTASGDARHRVVLSAVAVHRYRAANGSFPDGLVELTPTLITAVPRDPFDGQPMRLKQVNGRLVVYSIGPDGVDNGGSPMDKEGELGDITFTLSDGRQPPEPN